MRPIITATLVFFAWFLAWHGLERAYAWRPGGQSGSYAVTTTVTVGTSSAQALAADIRRASLWMCNASTSNTVFWSTGTFGAAAMNTAGSLPIPAQQCAIIDNTRFTDSVNMIASAGGTPVTILTWD